MHNFTLTEEQQMVRETIARFVADVAAPKALEHDEHRRFVRPQFDQLAELGMLGLCVSEADGGAGLGWLSAVVAIEEVAGACGSTARLLAVQAAMCGSALTGLPKGKDLLGELVSGAKLATWLGPEHGATARGDGDEVALAGSAPLVTAATEADVLLVGAQGDGGPVLCAVPRSAAQVTAVPALGFAAAGPGAVRLDATPGTVLARGAEAEAALQRARTGGCIASAALACGIAAASHRLSLAHAGERIAFGKPLLALQAVQYKLVEMRRRIVGARHLTYHAARLLDLGEDATEAAMLAKIDAVDAAILAGDEGVQIHGGYGYVVEYHVERHYRDAKTLEVLDDGVDALRDRLAALAP